MKKLFLIVTLFTLALVQAFPQTKEAKALWAEIQKNPAKYIYGQGQAATTQEATKLALENLVTSISSSVESEFDMSTLSITANGEISDKVTASQIVKTYSRMTIKGAKQIVVSGVKDKQKSVVCYITQDELNQMFAERGKKVKEYIRQGRSALKRGQVGTSMHKFYWAMALLRSYPGGEKIQFEDDDLNLQYAYQWLPDMIRKTIQNISITTEQIENDGDEKIITVRVTYNGANADDVTFTCNDGEVVYPDVVAVKDGVGEIYLPVEAKEKKLIATIDYKGEEESHSDDELANVIATTGVTFRQANVNLGRDIKKKQQTTYANVEIAKEEAVKASIATAENAKTALGGKVTATAEEIKQSVEKNILHYMDANEAAPYIPIAQKIESILRSRKLAQLQGLCTEDGWAQVEKLLSYGNARLVGYPNIQFLDNNGDITIRSYPMSFQFKSNGKRTFTENVVFHLDRMGKITQVAFALDKRSADDIFCHKGNWPDESKQAIVNFMETYKTAFALRDLDLIDKIFSDDALILIGRVVKPSPKKSEVQLNSMEKVEYTRRTKKEYISSLENAFNSNEYINLKFGETNVKRAGYTNRSTGKQMQVYGIQLKQDYYSQRYGDTGYLFLAVDLTDVQKPLIHVRTWQPTKDVTNGESFGLQDLGND